MALQSLLARVILAVVGILLIYAAWGKAHDGTAFVRVMEFNGLAGPIVGVFYVGIIVSEVLMGQLLLRAHRPTLITVVSLLMFAMFTLQLIHLSISDAAPSCGCLGRALTSTSARTEAVLGIVRNVVIMVGLVWSHRILRRGVP